VNKVAKYKVRVIVSDADILLCSQQCLTRDLLFATVCNAQCPAYNIRWLFVPWKNI